MTNDDMTSFMKKEFDRIIALKHAKGNAYGSDDDAFRSVTDAALELGMAPTELLFVYMTKHWDVIRHHRTNLGHVKDIAERLDDLVIYLMMMKALVVECPTENSEASSANTYVSLIGSR